MTEVQHRATGGRPVAEMLRKQADHMETYGTVATSPLAGMLRYGAINAAEVAAAAAIIGHLV